LALLQDENSVNTKVLVSENVENYILKSFMTCTPRKILLGWSKHWCDGWGR